MTSRRTFLRGLLALPAAIVVPAAYTGRPYVTGTLRATLQRDTQEFAQVISGISTDVNHVAEHMVSTMRGYKKSGYKKWAEIKAMRKDL